ncbi:hypothetical protein [Rathayibacter sp. Leaf248]|uniref:hypothetical protein n=1 Tax=Rathayibacter sp. Leaf248 TaxID=2876555 RepID=UPI001E288C18|nr:hypothetical protein [Rathayibacter sp. Leaf248]
MAKKTRKSVLADRIAAGKAESISPEERQIVVDLRETYNRKFGSRGIYRLSDTAPAAAVFGTREGTRA